MISTAVPSRAEVRFYKLAREHIVELIFIIEGYDGMGVVRTLNKEEGIIEILLSPDYETELDRLIEDLSRDFPIREISKPEKYKSILDD